MTDSKDCIVCWKTYFKKVNCSRKNRKKSCCCGRECSIVLFKKNQLKTAEKRKGIKFTEKQKKNMPFLFKPWHKKSDRKYLDEYRAKWWTPRNKWKYGYQVHGGFIKTRLQLAIRTCVKFLDWRKKVFERDNYTCKDCWIRSAKGTGRVKLHAHHIKAFSELLQQHSIQSFDEAMNCKELWDISNWQTLCKDCHKKTDSYKLNQYSK